MRPERFKDKYIGTREIDKLREELVERRRDIEARRIRLDEDLRLLEAQEQILGRLRPEDSLAEATATPPVNGKRLARRPARVAKHRREAPLSSQSHGAAAARRGDTTKMVLDAVRQHPGLDSAQLANLLQGQLLSDARNPRKLIHSTLGYLRDRLGKIRKDENGRYFPADGASASLGGA